MSRWSAEEKTVLLADYERYGICHCVKHLPGRSGTRWSIDDLGWLRRNYHLYTVRECAAALGRSENSVSVEAHRMGLSRRAFAVKHPGDRLAWLQSVARARSDRSRKAA